MADLSVIIPTFDRLWCLPRAIESCRHARCDTQIIVVDDGSSDGTWEWLQTQQDVLSVRQSNMGQTYAVNKGVSYATGRYIKFLDSDDILAAGALDAQYERACATGAQLVCSRVDLYEERTGSITIMPDITGWTDFMEVQLSNRYGSHFLGMLFHRDLVASVPRRPDYAFREDRMFLLEIALMEPKIAYTAGCGGYWVQHSGQMQGNYRGLTVQVTNWQHINIYKKILGELAATGRLTEERKAASCEVLWHIANWVAQKHLAEAEAIYVWIGQLCPGFRIPEKGLKDLLFRTFGFRRTQILLRLARWMRYGWQ